MPLESCRELTLDAAGVAAVGEGRVGTGDGQLGDDAPLLLLLSSSSLYTQHLCNVRLQVTKRLFLNRAGGGVLVTDKTSAGDASPSLLLASLRPHCWR